MSAAELANRLLPFRHRCLGCGDPVADDVMCVYCDVILERMPGDAVWTSSPYGPLQVGVDVPVPAVFKTIRDHYDGNCHNTAVCPVCKDNTIRERRVMQIVRR